MCSWRYLDKRGFSIGGIAGLALYGKYLPHAAIGYLAPMSVLLSFLICYFALIIMGTQAAYALGYYTGITTTMRSPAYRPWIGARPSFPFALTCQLGDHGTTREMAR